MNFDNASLQRDEFVCIGCFDMLDGYTGVDIMESSMDDNGLGHLFVMIVIVIVIMIVMTI